MLTKTYDTLTKPKKPKQGTYIKSIIYGGLDGIITTFAVVAGVAGANLSASIVLILGFANLIADGLSMSIGDFLSTRAEKEYGRAVKRYESWEVDTNPQEERDEMIKFFARKGVTKKDCEKIANILIKNKKATLDIMMTEEHGIFEGEESAAKSALYTFCSFVVFGFVPLLTFIIAPFVQRVQDNAFHVAAMLTGITLFALGAVKYRITLKSWLYSGLEMLFVGGLAALAAYWIGHFISIIV